VVPEVPGVRARLGAVVVATAACVLGVGSPARAGDECKGLAICIALTGPWVVVPAGSSGAPTYWELRCPRRDMIVAGLDADLGDRRIALEFFGALGGPIGPGVTTSDRVVFAATYTGTAHRPTTFRPRIGCIPTSGGGRETTGLSAPAGQLAAPRPLRRVRTVRLGTSPAGTLTQRCRLGERLLSSSAALAFGRKLPPDVALMQTVSLTRRVSGGDVLVTVSTEGRLPRSAGAAVQIHVVCGRR